MQFFGRHAPGLQRAGTKVLHQHIGFGNQAAGNILRLFLPQIERHRFLVARLHLPPDGGAVLQQPPVAQRVARARGFDLDHLGTKFAQGLAAERPGNQLPHLHHLDTLQRRRACILLMKVCNVRIHRRVSVIHG
ncbi:hypothetical protein D3C72_2012310 [compost metagenome]